MIDKKPKIIITIGQLRSNVNDTKFKECYTKLIVGPGLLENSDKLKLLKIAIVFINYGDKNLQKLGYRIILRYSTIFAEYAPLYDVAINKGYIPVSKYIEMYLMQDPRRDDKFFNCFISSYQENYNRSGIYLSEGQKSLFDFAIQQQGNFAVIAPTSYGKSEIIINYVYSNIDKCICILVPTKALLAQTKKRVIQHPNFLSTFSRVITHPEMYKGDESSFIAVLTQERMLRLLQKNPTLQLDVVMVDEAHNILKDNSRSELLAQVLLILKKRKPEIILSFFTPFLSDSQNLKSPYNNYELQSKDTTEHIKVERFYTIDLTSDKLLYFYDQFLNEAFKVNDTQYRNEIHFILTHNANKNILYLNRPKDIEKLALLLSSASPSIEDPSLNEMVAAISEFVHPDYNLLTCMRKGVVYHHGAMPDIVRLYVESIFSKSPFLKFITTNSTLLEGVNIPAEKIFVLTTKIGRSVLKKSEFKNLIGRVCRFSEVFKENGGLNLLEPEIYLIKGGFESINANHLSFLKRTAKVDLSFEDNVENVLMVEDVETMSQPLKDKLKSSLEYLENIERDTVNVPDISYVSSEIGKLCYLNNVYEFDIKRNTTILDRNLTRFENQHTNTLISNVGELVNAIFEIFINNIEVSDENLRRLENSPARRFYSMILDWRSSGSAYRQMIGTFIAYWRSLTYKTIYAGNRWGEIPFGPNSHKLLYVDLTTKTDKEVVNLAIVRVKEEQDFVDNTLIKFVEILADLSLLEPLLYDKVKYGTSDPDMISLLKNGFSMELSKLLLSTKYKQYISIDRVADLISINPILVQLLKDSNENEILIFELVYHVR